MIIKKSMISLQCITLILLGGCEESKVQSTEVTEVTEVAGEYMGGEVGSDMMRNEGRNEGDVESPIGVPPMRQIRRISVDQFARMIPAVTGGVRWVEDFGAGPVDMIELLALTLGAPDYRRVTEESLEPNLLMSKFLSDGAQRVCVAWVARDRLAVPEQRTLVKSNHITDDWDSLDPQHVRFNIARLLLRFFAYTAEPIAGNSRVEALAELFEQVIAVSPSDPSGDGWMTVCLALMTDPEFTLY